MSQNAADILFSEMHDLFGAHTGASAWREAADGLSKRREVRACYVTTEAALEYACRRLDADDALCLRMAYATGQALLFAECLRAKRQAPAFSALRVGTAEEVSAHRLYPIIRFTQLKPLYS